MWRDGWHGKQASHLLVNVVDLDISRHSYVLRSSACVVWRSTLLRSNLGSQGAERVAALERALGAFDLVGLVERFDETLLLLSDLIGIQVRI